MEDNFSTDQGQERSGFRMTQCIAFIAHFIIVITSAPPQILRH